MAKDIEEKIGAMSQKNWHVLNYKNPLKNYRVHEMPTGDQLPPHYTVDPARHREFAPRTSLAGMRSPPDRSRRWEQSPDPLARRTLSPGVAGEASLKQVYI